ncbi:DUF6232 family protein [Sphingomonas crocodyli]|uniref:DUF6232 family protein n=1 Tax=Sphingomonas crocodyli TaxID=1979270 RepID=UPI003B832798
MAVFVDHETVRFGSTLVKLTDIDRVEVRSRKPHSRAVSWVAFLLAIFMFPMIFVATTSSDRFNALIMVLVFSLVAWIWWQRAKIVEYSLYLITGSSETRACGSREHHDIVQMREQIEQAMSSYT